MIKNKKSIMFTFIAITLLMIVFISFLITLQTSTKSETDKIVAKTTSVNAFVQNTDVNMEAALKASANQAILALQDYMDTQDAYLTGSPNVVFRDAIADGKYKGQKLPLMEMNVDGELISFTIEETLNELKEIASRSNIILSYDSVQKNSITITMDSSWKVKAEVQVRNVKVADKDQELLWDLGDMVISGVLEISRYRDPFYLVSDDVSIPIKQTDITEFENPDQLNSFIDNFEFIAHSDSPDLIQRMFGQFDSTSSNGYETVLGRTGHDSNTPNPNSNSYVDFMYWGTKTSAVDCSVAGVPGIKLDDPHKIFYTGTLCRA